MSKKRRWDWILKASFWVERWGVSKGVLFSPSFFDCYREWKGERGVLMTLRVKFWTGWWEYSTVRESKTPVIRRQSVEEWGVGTGMG